MNDGSLVGHENNRWRHSTVPDSVVVRLIAQQDVIAQFVHNYMSFTMEKLIIALKKG
jgi:hypothetical protein